MFDLKSKSREVSERDYCVLESVYDDREREQMRVIFKQLCADKNSFSSESGCSVVGIGRNRVFSYQ